MNRICLYFAAHQPRYLKKNPTLAAPFDDQEARAQFLRLAKECYLPVNEALARLVKAYPHFHVAIGVSGTLLDAARRFDTNVLKSFQMLGDLAVKTGRIEFVGMPYHHSLASLFRDPAKEEFLTQVGMHAELLTELLGVKPDGTLVNTDLLFNNSLARVAGEGGFKAVLCERHDGLMSGAPQGTVFTDRLRRLKILPRNPVLSQGLAALATRNETHTGALDSWMEGLVGIAVAALPYDAMTGRPLDFLEALVKRLKKHEKLVSMTTPSGIATLMEGDLPAANVDDLATTSWVEPGRSTQRWFGNAAQQNLFLAYQQLETKVKTKMKVMAEEEGGKAVITARPKTKTGKPAAKKNAPVDENLLDIWRHLGAADHFSHMCTVPLTAVGSLPPPPNPLEDATLAISAYSAVLAELRCELGSDKASWQIKKKARRPRILLVTPEVTELPSGIGNLANFVHAKGGGLADISAALVAEMVRLGLDVHIALPKYESQIVSFSGISRTELDRLTSLFQTSEAIHLVQDSSFAYVKDVYEAKGFNSALHRAEAFQRAVINQVFDVAMPDHGKMLVHCNDWMTGLIPAAAKSRGIPSIFTLHNVHTNKDTLRSLERCGMDVSRFWKDLYLEKHPDFVPNPWETIGVDFLLSGIKGSNIVNTVSPTFLLEIVNGHFPDIVSWQVREEVKAKYNAGCAAGILNSPKSTVDPRIAVGLKRNFDETTVMEAKRENKIEFQKLMGLEANPDAPLFFWPHRLYEQKGPQLLAEIAQGLMQQYSRDGMQIALVGNGDARWERFFGELSVTSHGRMSYKRFNDALSELGKAGADFILMPSLYEPCGLPQMEGLRYGTLPVVRATGGLKDSIQHLDIGQDIGNGFVFNDFKSDAMAWAIHEAMRYWRQTFEVRQRTTRRVMRESMSNFNLENTTLQYVRLYERLLGEKLI